MPLSKAHTTLVEMLLQENDPEDAKILKTLEDRAFFKILEERALRTFCEEDKQDAQPCPEGLQSTDKNS